MIFGFLRLALYKFPLLMWKKPLWVPGIWLMNEITTGMFYRPISAMLLLVGLPSLALYCSKRGKIMFSNFLQKRRLAKSINAVPKDLSVPDSSHLLAYSSIDADCHTESETAPDVICLGFDKPKSLPNGYRTLMAVR